MNNAIRGCAADVGNYVLYHAEDSTRRIDAA
jgi:hypothetical protein